MLARSATKQQSKKTKRERQRAIFVFFFSLFTLELAQLPLLATSTEGYENSSYLGQQVLAAIVLARHGEEKKKKKEKKEQTKERLERESSES